MSLSSSLIPKYTATSSTNLSLGTFGVLISGLPSPMSDCASDELIPSVSSYINNISCGPFNNTEEPNLYEKIIMEHSYSRAWNWRPDVSAVKPARELMVHKPPLCPGCHDKNDDVIVDVVEPPSPQPPVPYDLDKGRALMSDIDKYLDTYTTNHDETDWEENINQDNWNVGEKTYYKRVTSIIHDDYLARTTLQNHHNEPLMRRVTIDGSVSRFRQAFNSVGYDIKMLQWLHNLLLDNLNKQLLSVYLDILQGLKAKLPTLIDKIMFNGVTRNGHTNNESLFPLLKKPWDPIGQPAIFNKMKRLPNNPIILVCPSFPQPPAFPTRHNRLITLLSGLAKLETVQVHIGPAGPRSTMTQVLEHMLASTRAKLQEIRADNPNQPIVLFGMHSGSALAFQIAQTETVACIVCIGFNVHTVEGKRGTPDDMLLDMIYPTLFVMGQNSDRTHPEEMENLREKMKADTSLIVVGSADDSLRIPKRKKLLEGITQSMVDRCIVDEIGDYITNILTNPFPVKKQLPVPNKVEQQLPVTKIRNSTKNNYSGIKRRISDASESADLKSQPTIPMKKPRPGVQQAHAAAPGTNKLSTGSSSSVGRPRGSIKNRGLSNSTTIQTGLQSVNNPPPGGVTVKIGSLRSPSKQRTASETEMMPPPPLKAIGSSKTYSQMNSKMSFHKNITAVEQLKNNLDNSDALDKAILSILPGEDTPEENESFVTTIPRSQVPFKQKKVMARTSHSNAVQKQKNNNISTSTLSALLQSPSESTKRFKVADNYTTVNRGPIITSNKIITPAKGQIDLSKLTLVPHASIKNNQMGTASTPMMLPLPSARLPNAKFVKISNNRKHVIIRPHTALNNSTHVSPVPKEFDPTSTTSAVQDVASAPANIENTNILDLPIVFADNDGNFNDDLPEETQLVAPSSQNTLVTVSTSAAITTLASTPQPKMVLINRPNTNNIIKTSVNIANLKNNSQYTTQKFAKLVLKRPTDGTVKINNMVTTFANTMMKPSTSTVSHSSLPFMENYDLEADIVASKVLKSNPLIIRQHKPETSPSTNSSQDSNKLTNNYPIVFNVDSDKKFKTLVTQDKHKTFLRSPIILKPGTQMRTVNNKTITVTRSLPSIVSRKQVTVTNANNTNELINLQTMQDFNFQEIEPEDQIESEMI